MPLICPKCGAYALNNTGRNPNSTKCVACNSITPANIFHLFIVTGASGSGKSTVVGELRSQLPKCIVFDSDLLWGRTGDHYHNNWLRIAYNIAQGGRYTIIVTTSSHLTDGRESLPRCHAWSILARAMMRCAIPSLHTIADTQKEIPA